MTVAWSYILGLGPPFVYLILCFILKADTQVYVAYIATAFYAILMVAVLIGTIVEIASDGIFGPSGIFFVCMYTSFCDTYTPCVTCHPMTAAWFVCSGRRNHDYRWHTPPSGDHGPHLWSPLLHHYPQWLPPPHHLHAHQYAQCFMGWVCTLIY